MTDDGLRVPLLEVFSTFQGEGLAVGERQVFVRLAGCDLRCAYCDTPESFPAPGEARVQRVPGEEGDDLLPNPVSVDEVIDRVLGLDAPRGLHRAVSLTGGEPLLHPDALVTLGAAWREKRLDVHLETGGHRPEALERVLPFVDRVSPDLKLESATGQPTPWEAHRETYHLLERTGKGLAVKAIVVRATPADEIERAADFCRENAPTLPLVLQPVTPVVPGGPEAPEVADLFRLHAAAAARHPDVRVVPQVHRLLGVR